MREYSRTEITVEHKLGLSLGLPLDINKDMHLAIHEFSST